MDKDTVIRDLERKGIKIRLDEIDTTRVNNLGIKTLGRIDFLVNYHKYIVIRA